MPEITPEFALIAAILSVALAVALWIVTNLHVLRVGRSIKADIDAKRSETETFVRDELTGLKSSISGDMAALGSMEARLRAELPPNLDGRFEELSTAVEARGNESKAEIEVLVAQLHRDMGVRADSTMAKIGELESRFDQLVEDLRGRFDNLPAEVRKSIQFSGWGNQGVEQKAIQALASQHEGEIEGAMSIQEAVLAQDPEALQLAALKKVASFKFTDKYAEEHPLIAMALEIGKPKVLEIIRSGMPGLGAPSVTLAPVKGRSKSNLEM